MGQRLQCAAKLWTFKLLHNFCLQDHIIDCPSLEVLWHNIEACVSLHFKLREPQKGQLCSNTVTRRQSLFIEKWVAQVQSVCEQTLSICSWTQIHSFIHIKSGGSSSIDKEIYLRREQGGVGELAKPWVKTKAAGNEKRSEAANHPAFLTNGYQRVTGSKVRALWMASPAVCHEERVEPPVRDPRESALPPPVTQNTSGPDSTTAAGYYVEDVSLVCLSSINLIPTSLWPPRWTRDWQAQKAKLSIWSPAPNARKEVLDGGAFRVLTDWLIALHDWKTIYTVCHMTRVEMIQGYNNVTVNSDDVTSLLLVHKKEKEERILIVDWGVKLTKRSAVRHAVPDELHTYHF